ncbi:hypothetical protein [Flavobacterium sp. SORGH_AS_0622]|uniref:hypothetical protein n=1 Tax=Flavobacterium sp. SORGH_AS_0622 TaxID=3041772 RepID=UPI00277DAF74|nr:hypothetical protein [Flavobacterium sp. SORGH_AS_0622]MDQ1164851.1 hypothetical protein [Flavobacterium sp. SORGH_AS_0622]
MKKFFFILLTILFLSCSTKKQQTTKPFIENNLTEIRSNIVNDFLDFELKTDRYTAYKNYDYIIIKEALKKRKSILAYEFSYNEFYKRERNRNYWILDSIQIQNIKSDLANEEIYIWKGSDFKKIKVNLLNYEELKAIIKLNDYSKIEKKLIIYLSTPLIIDKDNALISFEIGNGSLGFNSITHFTVLMKNKNEKWVKDAYFEDGVFN